ANVVPDGIEFKSGNGLVAKYATDSKYSKPFLYPLLAPGQLPVTRAYPIEPATPGGSNDHIHQKSVWFCHGDIIPEGIELKIKAADKTNKGVDFWSESKDKDGTKRHGQIKCVKIGEPKITSKNQVSVETLNEWFTPDGVKIIDEVRTIHFFERAEGRLFAFDIVLKATVCPIRFGDTKEGSFGIRTHDALRPSEKSGATVTSAEGKIISPPVKDNLLVWGQPSAWIDYSGKVDGGPVGIAVFDHPSNPQASWHARAYGLNAANPFGREGSGFPSQKGKTDLFQIEKGGELKLKYAVYAHSGDAKTGKVAEAYEGFKNGK
ncbi:MAG TPA: PmoA family protein, partial [Gemmata sp.]|nr:PmoA family protein [Gemmata sp.]